MAGRWGNLSVHKCADVSAILNKLKRTGATLPAAISPQGGELLDLAEIVVGNDSIWNGLPDSFRFEGYNGAETRAVLRNLVRASK